MACSNRRRTPNNMSKNQIRRQRGSEVMDTNIRENRPTFASRRSRPRSGWANGTLKLLLAPDWPDRTVSEKLEKSLGCSTLASPEATELVFLQFFVQIGSTKLSMEFARCWIIGISHVPWIQGTNRHKWGRKFF